MTIRHSTSNDLPAIMALIDEGKQKMMAEGNTRQWTKGHPSRQQIADDIDKGNSYVIADDDDEPVATFALMAGPDPTYAQIYQGQWLNERPYYVIHRVASSARVHGVMSRILNFAFGQTDTVRVDTHEDNQTMQALLGKHGFSYCGIIHLANGDPRMAYMKTID